MTLNLIRKERPNVALFYLKNALDIEQSDANMDDLNISGTHLNLCAIYSKLGKHIYSIYHARNAIKLIEKILREKDQLN